MRIANLPFQNFKCCEVPQPRLPDRSSWGRMIGIKPIRVPLANQDISAGLVCLNSFGVLPKWIPALFRPLSGLMEAH
jgi:hypothetical protein